MNNEEKILEVLVAIQDRLDGIDTRLDGIDTRLDGIDTRLDGMDSRMDRMESRLDKVESEVHDVRVLVDVDIDRKLKLLAEGQEAILNEMKTKTPITRTKRLEDEHSMMVYTVKGLVRDVEELKAAK